MGSAVSPECRRLSLRTGVGSPVSFWPPEVASAMPVNLGASARPLQGLGLVGCSILDPLIYPQLSSDRRGI